MTCGADLAALHARLDALAAAGVAAPRLRRAEALLRRVPGQDEALAQLLLQRARVLLEESPPQAASATPARAAHARDRGLAELRQRLACAREMPSSEVTAAAPAAAALQPSALLQEARLAWRTLRARSQLQQALAQPQEHAGPLNSSRLLLRALEAMQATAPGYAECFLAHVDALAALEPLLAAPARADAAPRRAARTRKRRD